MKRNLLEREFTAKRMNEKWARDITFAEKEEIAYISRR